MRLPVILLTAASLIAVTAAAQDAPPHPTKAEPGLADLSTTVGELQDEPAPAATPAQTTPEQPADASGIPPELDDRGTRIEAAAVGNVAPMDGSGQPIAAPAAAAETPAPAPPAPPTGPRFIEPLTPAQRDQLVAASARGRLLGAIDRAGRIATQDMLGRVSDPAAAGIAGWIAEPQGNGVAVTFYAAPVADAPPGIVFRANILAGRVVSRDVYLAPEGRPALNAVQARMAAARAVAAAQGNRPCGGDEFNLFAVPPAGPAAPVEVYSISPQAARGRFPLGGHFKTMVAPDGSVAATRAFANACVNLDVPDVPAGQRPAPLAVTHLLDPLPTEIHAFLSAWTGRPLVVVAGDPQRLFGVTPDGMGEMPREAARGR